MSDAERRGPTNVETLKAAGLIVQGDDGGELPEEYHDVFESLSDEEICCLIRIKARLDATQNRFTELRHYAAYVVPP